MSPETLREVGIMFGDMNRRFDDLVLLVQENTKITRQVLDQATKTNGRATEL